MIIVPEQAKENLSKSLSDLEDTLIDLNVPVWKVVIGGLALVGVFVGSFILFFELYMALFSEVKL